MSNLKFKFKMPDDETLARYISIKGEKGEKGDPTKLSQLENDTGFVTANTDALANYYTKAQTDSAIDADVEALETELGVPGGFFTDTTETVTGQGTAIILNGTSNAVFKDIKLYGATVQNGTPTPESPVEIQTVTGEQTIVITDNDQQSQSYTLSLGDIELCKVENYQDYIWKDGDKWKLHKEVGKVVLDGSIAAWEYYASGNNTVFMLGKSDASYGSATSNPILASRFKSKFAAENGCIYLSSASRRLNICTDITDNPVDWRSWLASNPATAYYALATATDEELTNQTLISQLNAFLGARTFEGQTLVTANGEISTGLYVEAFRDNWSGSMAGVDANLAELKEEVDAKASLVEFAMKPYYFDTVAEMKSANLDEGDCCITLGYYSANDGGGAKYKIIDSAETADGGSLIALNNGLKAQLIVENNTINVKQFGAKGDGTTDDTAKITLAISKCPNVYLPTGSYKLTSKIDLSNNSVTIYGDGAKLSRRNYSPKTIIISPTNDYAFKTAYPNGCFFKRLSFQGNGIDEMSGVCEECDFISSDTGIYYVRGQVDRCFFNCTNYGIYKSVDGLITDCVFADCGTAISLHGSDNRIINNRIDWNNLGIELSSASYNTIEGNIFDRQTTYGITSDNGSLYNNITGNLFERNLVNHLKGVFDHTTISSNKFLKKIRDDGDETSPQLPTTAFDITEFMWSNLIGNEIFVDKVNETVIQVSNTSSVNGNTVNGKNTDFIYTKLDDITIAANGTGSVSKTWSLLKTNILNISNGAHFKLANIEVREGENYRHFIGSNVITDVVYNQYYNITVSLRNPSNESKTYNVYAKFDQINIFRLDFSSNQ